MTYITLEFEFFSVENNDDVPNYSQPQHAKMDLNKKSLPEQKTIKTLKYNPQGFKITINENPHKVDFFCEQILVSLYRDRTGDLWIRSLTRYQLS